MEAEADTSQRVVTVDDTFGIQVEIKQKVVEDDKKHGLQEEIMSEVVEDLTFVSC